MFLFRLRCVTCYTLTVAPIGKKLFNATHDDAGKPSEAASLKKAMRRVIGRRRNVADAETSKMFLPANEKEEGCRRPITLCKLSRFLITILPVRDHQGQALSAPFSPAVPRHLPKEAS
jgi:hypothetical protein